MFNLFRRSRQMQVAPEHGAAYRVAKDVTAHVTDDALVLLHEERGLLFTANGVGARIWLGISRDQTLEHIACGLQKEYQVPFEEIMDDARSFIGDLRERGLLLSGANS